MEGTPGKGQDGNRVQPTWSAVPEWGNGVRRWSGGEAGVRYAAAAQGIRRFWKRAPNSPEMQAFVAALLDQLANGQI